MKRYVVGFLFRNNGTEVALVRKLKPEWQRGRLNGIGGKIEPNEDSRAAMMREFAEETGANVDDWRAFAWLRGVCGFAGCAGDPPRHPPRSRGRDVRRRGGRAWRGGVRGETHV